MKLFEISSRPFVLDRRHIERVAKKVVRDHPLACKRKDFLFGLCAPLTYHFWNALGRPKDFLPYSVMIGEDEHVVLYNKKLGIVLDIAGNQFNQPLINLNPGVYGNFYRLSKQEVEELKNS